MHIQDARLNRKHRRCIIPVLAIWTVLLVSTCNRSPRWPTYEDFPDVLDIKNVPHQENDWSAFCFSDRGAWFGFALPDVQDSTYAGSFPGPFLMTHGRWPSPGFVQFTVKEAGAEEEMDFSSATASSIHYYPGRLVQRYTLEDLRIHLDLIFVSSRSVLIRAELTNRAPEAKACIVGWKGTTFFEKARLAGARDGVAVRFEDEKTSAHLMIPDAGSMRITVNDQKSGYQMTSQETIRLEPGGRSNAVIAFSLCFDAADWKRESAKVSEVLRNPDPFFEENRVLWNGYLRDVLRSETRWVKEPAYRRIAVKALLTLINNWRCARGDLFHDGLFPSAAVGYFNGFWAWDSWKHAVALARFAPELAKDQVRAMIDYQDDAGMVADVIYADKSENNWRDTKPPLAAWAVEAIFRETGDRAFLEEIAPKLLKYHRWWFAYRDHDRNGLCEYGSTDGSLVAAKWESGMDDGLRFDQTQMVKNREGAWSMDQESVDLNSYLYAEKLFLASILDALGEKGPADEFREETEALKSKIQARMFDEKTGFFYDVRIADGSFVRVMGPEGWIPLWAGVATPQQAARVKQVMTDSTRFATFIPFPTIPADHRQFMTGYWRGPVWLDQAYFGVRALERYGFQDEAEVFTRNLFDRLEGLKDAPDPIRENYDPRDGRGLNVHHFSWSAAHLLMLFWGE